MPDSRDRFPVSPLTVEEGELIGRLRSTLGRLEAALAAISDALVITDADGCVLWCNQAFEALAQQPRLRLLGRSILAVLPCDAEGRPLLEAGQFSARSSQGACQRVVLRHDPLLAVSIEWRPVLSEPERPLVFCIRDISADLASEAMRQEVDRIAAERERLEAQALACAVTGLPNRRALEERLALAFLGLRQQPGQLTLLFCDLNGFKQVNDQLGHAAGDALLAIVGQRLQSCLRASDLVARLGGDEFVVLSLGPHGREEALDLGMRLLEEVCRPWSYEDRPLQPSISVGIAITRDPDLGAAELLRRADQAMYDAKAADQPSLALHDRALERRTRTRQRVGQLLHQAITGEKPEGQRLTLRRRPILELGSGRVHGHEALPELLIPGEEPCSGPELLLLAERLGLTAPLARWLRTAALAQLDRQAAAGSSLLAFRISGSELREEGLSSALAGLTTSHRVDPGRIALLLPDALLQDPPAALHTELMALRGLGLQVVLDDFGAGTTPLRTLARLPLTAIRLHPDLCSPVHPDQPLTRLRAAAIRLALDLDLEVIAEGLVSETQCRELQRLGCRFGQGSHVDRVAL